MQEAQMGSVRNFVGAVFFTTLFFMALAAVMIPAHVHAESCPIPHPMCIPAGAPPKGKDGMPCMCHVNGDQPGVCGGGQCIGKEQGGLPMMMPMLPMIPMMMPMPDSGSPGGASSNCSNGGSYDAAGNACPCPTGMTRQVPGDATSQCIQQSTITIDNATTSSSTQSSAIDSLLTGEVGNATTSHASKSPIDTIQDITREIGSFISNVGYKNTSTTVSATATTSVQVKNVNGGTTFTGNSVDKSTNTGVGSFIGVARGTVDSVVSSLCTARPWQLSFVQRIFSSDFFDSICTSHGVVRAASTSSGNSVIGNAVASTIGPITLVCPQHAIKGDVVPISWQCPRLSTTTSSIGFSTGGMASGTATTSALVQTTTFTVLCSGIRKQCTTQVVIPKVDLVAHPTRVALSARSRLYWTSQGVSDCTITGPGLREQGTEGAVTTGSILDSTDYTATCTGPHGTVISDTVTVDIGQ